MKRLATPWLLLLAAWGSWTLQAQPSRLGQDAVWARDVGAATFTLDGQLTEAQWGTAESVRVKWGELFAIPGGGSDDFFNGDNPIPGDPIDATVRFLRKGNTIWIGVTALDKSVGADVSSPDFWRADGIVLAMLNKNRRPELPYTGAQYFRGVPIDEFFVTWRDQLTPGALATANLAGGEGESFVDSTEVWESATTVQGTSNDDTGADDTGYTIEIRMDVSNLGWDLSTERQAIPFSFGMYDMDYGVAAGDSRRFFGRTWFQNPWGNDMPHGIAYILTSPTVTTAGVAPPFTDPDLTLGNYTDATITLDGKLDEPVWDVIGDNATVTLQYQMTPAMLDAIPGFAGPYQTHWFRPGGDDPAAPPVVDPSTVTIKMFYQGTTLYVGASSDDGGISAADKDAVLFGIKTYQRAAGEDAGAAYPGLGYRIGIGEGGAAVLRGPSEANPGFTGAVALLGASTAGDANDVDEGFQMEWAIDLTQDTLALGDRRILYIGAHYLDADELPDPSQNYETKTWWLIDNPGIFAGPLAAAYLDPTPRTSSNEDVSELPSGIRLLGNYPNPFNPSTRITYALPQAGQVTVQVFDATGRLVRTLAGGVQAAGSNFVDFRADDLASGLYAYRVQVQGSRSFTATGRMVLMK